jgi:hypothetical protein
MLNDAAVLAKYRENYEMAIEDGHTENASKIAWIWTEEAILNSLFRIKENHEAGHNEAINKAFFG